MTEVKQDKTQAERREELGGALINKVQDTIKSRFSQLVGGAIEHFNHIGNRGVIGYAADMIHHTIESGSNAWSTVKALAKNAYETRKDAARVWHEANVKTAQGAFDTLRAGSIEKVQDLHLKAVCKNLSKLKNPEEYKYVKEMIAEVVDDFKRDLNEASVTGQLDWSREIASKVPELKRDITHIIAVAIKASAMVAEKSSYGQGAEGVQNRADAFRALVSEEWARALAEDNTPLPNVIFRKPQTSAA